MLLDNIKKLCRENSTTFAAVEREIGLGNGVISRWGSSAPRIDSLKAVADHFGVTVDELISGSDAK